MHLVNCATIERRNALFMSPAACAFLITPQGYAIVRSCSAATGVISFACESGNEFNSTAIQREESRSMSTHSESPGELLEGLLVFGEAETRTKRFRADFGRERSLRRRRLTEGTRGIRGGVAKHFD